MLRLFLKTRYNLCAVHFSTNAQFVAADLNYTQLFSDALQSGSCNLVIFVILFRRFQWCKEAVLSIVKK